ncbi:MAG: S-methyl-5-thioribose-1-phosphate isomerase [Firmicutes bacterium]|jgi:methylthioribose-1-phosphate isomerase|nr:S-methyl-5-thioribose-1-phosphate isomerase [Bacillota bacterium]
MNETMLAGSEPRPSLVPIAWDGQAGAVRLIDQTLLPVEVKYMEVRTLDQMIEAVKALRVRGAPAIGIAAAFGVYLAVKDEEFRDSDGFLHKVREACQRMGGARPTAVNLSWALARVRRTAEVAAREATGTRDYLAGGAQEGMRQDGSTGFAEAILREALAMIEEDHRVCRAIGVHGATLILEGAKVLTHCNAGGLATAGLGTALATMFVAHEQGRRFEVWVDETRPLLQGSRLTAFELAQAGIQATVICDNMAASLMGSHQVDLVMVGADRVAANGDVCNKIGTYGLACLARMHGIPFYAACPTSTLDLATRTGDDIPIEQRDPREVTHGFGRQTAPDGVAVYNPAFDVTPGHMVTAIVTERGIVHPPYRKGLAEIAGGGSTEP